MCGKVYTLQIHIERGLVKYVRYNKASNNSITGAQNIIR